MTEKEIVIDDLNQTVRFRTKRGDFMIYKTENDTINVTSGAKAVLCVQPNANNSIDIYGTKYTGGRI